MTKRKRKQSPCPPPVQWSTQIIWARDGKSETAVTHPAHLPQERSNDDDGDDEGSGNIDIDDDDNSNNNNNDDDEIVEMVWIKWASNGLISRIPTSQIHQELPARSRRRNPRFSDIISISSGSRGGATKTEEEYQKENNQNSSLPTSTSPKKKKTTRRRRGLSKAAARPAKNYDGGGKRTPTKKKKMKKEEEGRKIDLDSNINSNGPLSPFSIKVKGANSARTSTSDHAIHSTKKKKKKKKTTGTGIGPLSPFLVAGVDSTRNSCRDVTIISRCARGLFARNKHCATATKTKAKTTALSCCVTTVEEGTKSQVVLLTAAATAAATTVDGVATSSSLATPIHGVKVKREEEADDSDEDASCYNYETDDG